MFQRRKFLQKLINGGGGETQQHNMRTEEHIGRNFTINKTKRKLIKYKIKILHLSLDNKKKNSKFNC